MGNLIINSMKKANAVVLETLILKYPDKEVHSLLVYIGKEQHNNMHRVSQGSS